MKGSKKMGLFDHSSPKWRGKTSMMVMGVFLSGTMLNACSQVPDAVNPVEWYRGTVDLFAGDGDDANKQSADNNGKKNSGLVADRGTAPPGSDKTFPNLSSVDKQARARVVASDNTSGGLSADSERPKYAPALQRQGAASSNLQAQPRPAPVAPPAVSATQPAPVAMPKAPVTSTPMAQGQLTRPMPSMPVPQPAPQMAKPGASPQLAPAVMTTSQMETEKRLARQLAEIRARAAELGDLPIASPGAPTAQADHGTLVISSDGVVSDGLMAADQAPQTQTAAQTPALPSGQAGTSQMIDSPAVYAGNAVRVATILFENGSSLLKSRDKRILNAVVRLQRKNGGQVQIVGHASSRTRNLSPIAHKMTNFAVSAKRADKVAGELMRLGVNKKDILIAAVSDAEPAFYEIMPSGEAGNRRTDIYLVN